MLQGRRLAVSGGGILRAVLLHAGGMSLQSGGYIYGLPSCKIHYYNNVAAFRIGVKLNYHGVLLIFSL